MAAVRFLFERLKIVVEPSGALGLAALLSGTVKAQGKIGVVLSGGNMDGDTLGRIMAATRAAGNPAGRDASNG